VLTGVEEAGDPRMLGGGKSEFQTTAHPRPRMDRHVEFVTQLSHLVALYVREPLDRAAEKTTLRAARGAVKHGAVTLAVLDGTLRGGREDAPVAQPDVAALQLLLTALGVERIEVAHHTKQEEIKRLSRLLASVASGSTKPADFARVLAEREWSDVTVTCGANTVAAATPAENPAAEPAAAEPTPEPLSAEPPAAEVAAADAPADGALAAEPLPPSAPPVESHPLAEQLPDAVEGLVGPAHRELFVRLITSSDIWMLRRLLEPVQVAIEQTARAGAVVDSARLILAMFACEACADDPEMRRQFVVTLRRLTKPTLTRAYAMIYATAAEHRGELEQVLARFGEDGAEAVADCIGSAGAPETRAVYRALLGRLPGANDALLAMLDDQREVVVERAVVLIVELRHPEMERVLGDALGHRRPRVRKAAARGLTAARDSAFAADALMRAAQDASPDVRLIAAVGLQARREERLVPPLLPLLDVEEELDVQLALLGVLGRIVTAEGVQKLVALANPTERMMRRRRTPVLRLSAMEALGEARTPAAMVALQKLLEDKEKEVREAAARLYTRARRQTAAMSVSAVTDA